MDYKKLAFCLSIVCCLTLVGMGTVLFVMYGNLQAQFSETLAIHETRINALESQYSRTGETEAEAYTQTSTASAAATGTDLTTSAPTGTDLTTSAPTGTDLTTSAPTGTDLTTSAPTGTDLTTSAPTGTDLTTSAPTGTDLTTSAPTGTDLTTSAPTGTDLTTSAPTGNGCEDLLNAGSTSDGVYTINIGSSPVQVSCDMTNGGWTIIQKRFDGSTNFRQDFNTYAAGFGDPKSEYWLGLAKIHELTKEGQWALKVDLTAPDDDTAFAEYEIFKVGASPRYQLGIGSYNGNAGDSMARSNGMAFSTYDKDQDVWSGRNCAADVHRDGAWWWRGCGYSNLNAYTYNDGRSAKGMFWYHFKGWSTPMKASVMKIRKL